MTALANNIGDLLTRRAALNPEREAVYDVARGLRLSFSELAERAHRLANALIDDGVKPGDRVGLLLMNSAEFIESFFAIARLGAVVVPLNWEKPESTFPTVSNTSLHRVIFLLSTVAESDARAASV